MIEKSRDDNKADSTSKFEDACDALTQAAKDISLLSSKCGGTSILQSMLESKDVAKVATALRALRHYDPRQILELVLPIYRLTEVSVHYFSAVRLLAMIPAKTLRHTLVPLVFDRLLDPDNGYDYYSWRLNALMLEYFGFDDTAQSVAILALASDDPEVREVGAEMIAEMATPGSPPYG
ncbi:hypothetical protein EII34_12625 [Arachnia propionica]|uniref:HEAT repeat domain-containing protein n=1 Tax=Arachnia propionica TaxID=1750 RepID=A0A3P1T2T8_9ACTN|nr:hypothetical protein [Arachnia propionica]RRD03837.1 hypothetical protein EII34_12625 [Arachnia propionica]